MSRITLAVKPTVRRRPVEPPKESSAPVDHFFGMDRIRSLVTELIGLKDTLLSLITTVQDKLIYTDELARQIHEIQKGEPGKDGEDLTELELMPHIKYIVKQVKSELKAVTAPPVLAGKPGTTPVFGVDYFTPAHQRKMVEKVLKSMPQPKEVEVPTIDHSQLAIAVIAEILDKKLIKTEHVDGLAETISSYRNQLARGAGYIHGGGDTVKAGANITVTRNQDGTTTISGPAPGTATWYRGEKITLAGDSKTFTLTNAPTSVVNLTLDRQLQLAAVDYTGTIDGVNKTFAFVTAVDASLQDIIYADYS